MLFRLLLKKLQQLQQQRILRLEDPSILHRSSGNDAGTTTITTKIYMQPLM
jgi:hypothetical protein